MAQTMKTRDHIGALNNGGSQHRIGTTILEAQWQVHGPRPVQSQGPALDLMLWGYRNGILNLRKSGLTFSFYTGSPQNLWQVLLHTPNPSHKGWFVYPAPPTPP